MSVDRPSRSSRPARSRPARRRRCAASCCASCCASQDVHGRRVHPAGFWIVCAIFGTPIAPHRPATRRTSLAINKAPSGAHLFGTDQLGRDMFSRVIVGVARHPDHRAAGDAARDGARHGARPGDGLLPRRRRRRRSAASSRRSWRCRWSSPACSASVALGASNRALIVVIGIVFTPLIARTVRAAVLLERELDYVAAARLRGERSPYIMFVEILPERARADHRRVHGPARLRGLHGR